jgi:hypothetical protein
MPRLPLEQTFTSQSLLVSNVSAVPIGSQNINNLIIAFMICNFSSNTSSVFFGSAGITATSGIEITPGSAPLFTIDEVRQLYEIETPAENLVALTNCGVQPTPISIPILVWNPMNIWIIAGGIAPVPVSLIFFNNVYS